MYPISDIKNHYILPVECSCGFHLIIRISSDCYSEHH